MKRLMLVVGLCSLGFLWAHDSAATNYTLVTFEASGGTRYALSTLTETGSCVAIPDGKRCTDSGRQTSATNAGGCGIVSGGAMCVVIPDPWIPIYSLGASTLECPGGRNYEVTHGGTGSCDANGLGSMSCTEAGTKNFASATCTTGCGVVSGTGKCTVN